MATRKRVITSLTDLADQKDKGESVFFQHQDHPLDLDRHNLFQVFEWVKEGKIFTYEEYVEDPNRITIEELQWLNRWLRRAELGYGFEHQDHEIQTHLILKLEKQIQK